MPELTRQDTAVSQQKMDRQLLLSLTLSPLAAGINTIVGYTVAHWVAITASKRTGYLTAAACFVLCGMAALLAANAQRKITTAADTSPREGRERFMAQLALLLCAFCTLVVLAGTLVLVTVRPND